MANSNFALILPCRWNLVQAHFACRYTLTGNPSSQKTKCWTKEIQRTYEQIKKANEGESLRRRHDNMLRLTPFSSCSDTEFSRYSQKSQNLNFCSNLRTGIIPLYLTWSHRIDEKTMNNSIMANNVGYTPDRRMEDGMQYVLPSGTT
jgi:hypothetical protein